MAIQVNIAKGYYRGLLVTGTFELVHPYKEGAKGGFITIRNPSPLAGTPPVQRVQVQKGDFTMLNDEGVELSEHEMVETTGNGVVVHSGTNYEQMFMESESEEDALVRIADTFQMLEHITDACAEGLVRGLVVSGPPGIGKSWGVEKQLAAANLFCVMAGKDPEYEIISGGISPVNLFKKLYYNRDAKRVLVFDDCDGVLFDEEMLNMLKAALNSGDRRRICYNKESRVLREDDIPESFDFHASVIFLSNIDFEASIARQSRISSHLEAIMSRCHYLDLEIGSMRDRLLRIKQIVRDGMLTDYNFSDEQQQEIVTFVHDNSEYMREVSLRAVKKIADFVKADPVGWRRPVEATILTRDAKFKRLLENKQRAAAQKGVVLAEQA